MPRFCARRGDAATSLLHAQVNVSASTTKGGFSWLVRGDIDGFFGLALDNLVQLLLIDGLCRFVLGFDDALLYGRVLPGVGISLLIGNVFYAWQAKQLASATGRSDVCALPYGINTVSLFAHVFLVMLPVKLAAEAAGAEDPAALAWQAGLLATFGSGVIELSGSFVADWLRKATPRAALLSTLAGIALGFISLGFLFRTFAQPIVGLTTFAVVMLTYFGRVSFRGRLPGGLVAVLLGAAIAWMTGIAPVGEFPQGQLIAVAAPFPALFELFSALSDTALLGSMLGVIVPMGLFNVVGSLQNIESAEAAGDSYQVAPSLAANGVGTLAASFFGSCFPTTIYIGHPAWKAMGARAGYSVLNGVVMTLICMSSSMRLIAWLVPIEAGMAIVLWIGIVITAQAFTATPKEHAPAVVIGLLPGVAAWGAILAKNGLRAAGTGVPGGPAFDPNLVQAFKASDTWIHGAFALEQGFIFSSMVLAASTVAVIQREFRVAAIWCAAGGVLSLSGLMHAYAWGVADTTLVLSPAWDWAIGYFAMATIFAIAPWVTTPSDVEHG